MKNVDRRNFLKVVGVGVGAAALASVPMGFLNSAGQLAGGGSTAFSFAAEGALPADGRRTMASLVLRGQAGAGSQVSGFLNQRVVAGHPARPEAEALPRMGLTGRIDRVQNGSAIEVWGTVDEAADGRIPRDRNFHLSIDRGSGMVTYRFQGRSHQLQLKEFNAR